MNNAAKNRLDSSLPSTQERPVCFIASPQNFRRSGPIVGLRIQEVYSGVTISGRRDRAGGDAFARRALIPGRRGTGPRRYSGPGHLLPPRKMRCHRSLPEGRLSRTMSFCHPDANTSQLERSNRSRRFRVESVISTWQPQMSQSGRPGGRLLISNPERERSSVRIPIGGGIAQYPSSRRPVRPVLPSGKTRYRRRALRTM